MVNFDINDPFKIIMRVKNKILIFLVAISIALGAFVFGYSLVCVSMMEDPIQKYNELPDSQIDYWLSVITTALPLGALAGTFAMKFLADSFGENKAMLISDSIAILSCIVQLSSFSLVNLCVGRFLIGIYCGLSSGIIPSYLMSIAPQQISGIVGSFNQLLITIGIAMAYYMGQFVEDLELGEQVRWQLYIALPIIFCLIRILTLLLFQFDTLERHFANNQTEKIQQYLDLFYEDATVDQFCNYKRYDKRGEQVQQGESSKRVMRLAIVLAIANQLSGINAILFYAKQVFYEISNGDEDRTNQYVLSLGIFQVIITFISGFLINQFGRRTLMLIGEFLVTASLIAGFFFHQFIPNSANSLIFIIFFHLLGFSLSLGPVSMLYVAEILQNLTAMVFVIWFLTLLVAFFSEQMIASWGIGRVFLFYGLISGGCWCYLFSHMVESKGLSRQQIVQKITESNNLLSSLDQENGQLKSAELYQMTEAQNLQ